jgi:isopenicillin N synthase-like dioxygenase
MENLSLTLLEACALYLEKDKNWFTNMAADGNTILRVIHYPPISKDADPQSVRSAAHEDINLITLLVGATADGLEVQDHDGSWIAIEGSHDHIIVDTGDMIQNITNGLFKATTHRVVNPKDATGDRYSMPLFVHPRNEIDLSPRTEFISQTGGVSKYPSITAGEYLQQRLSEIGLKK